MGFPKIDPIILSTKDWVWNFLRTTSPMCFLCKDSFARELPVVNPHHITSTQIMQRFWIGITDPRKLSKSTQPIRSDPKHRGRWKCISGIKLMNRSHSTTTKITNLCHHLINLHSAIPQQKERLELNNCFCQFRIVRIGDNLWGTHDHKLGGPFETAHRGALSPCSTTHAFADLLEASCSFLEKQFNYWTMLDFASIQ